VTVGPSGRAGAPGARGAPGAPEDGEFRALRDTVRRFVEREVLPVAGRRERDDDYPGDLLPALAELGVLGMSIPEEHGGSGLDLVGYALVFEELARGWMGLASVVGSSQSGCWLLSNFGTDEQRQRFLPDLATGRRMSGIALDRGRIYMAAASVGIARAALEAATRYATERQAFGKEIGEHQAIKLKLAGMAIRVRAARLLTRAAAAGIDREGRARSDAAMAKVFAFETAIECSLEAMRVLGGYGDTTDFPVERLYRDAPLMAIGEGTNEILQLVIADELLAAARAAR